MTDELKPCPFCGHPPSRRTGVNPYGRCDTEGCWAHERKITIPFDDHNQVRAWNTRHDFCAENAKKSGAAPGPAAEKPIGRDEMLALFGDEMPIEAINLLWGSDGSKTCGQIRAELRQIAFRQQAIAQHEGGEPWGLPKATIEAWALGFSRTPHIVLKAFIDAGLCSDQSPSREETRLFPTTQPQPAADDGLVESLTEWLDRTPSGNTINMSKSEMRVIINALTIRDQQIAALQQQVGELEKVGRAFLDIFDPAALVEADLSHSAFAGVARDLYPLLNKGAGR